MPLACLAVAGFAALSLKQFFNQNAHKNRAQGDFIAGIAAHEAAAGAFSTAGQWVPIIIIGEPNLVAFSGTDAAGCARYQIIGPATRNFDGSGTTAIRCKKNGQDIYSFK